MHEIPLTKSNWSAKELHLKTVEFAIPINQDFIMRGIGQFFATGNPEGLHRIELVTDVQGRHWAERIQTRYALPQAVVDRIQEHTDKTIAAFRLR